MARLVYLHRGGWNGPEARLGVYEGETSLHVREPPMTTYTTRQAAEMLGTSATSVRRWVRQGRLECGRTFGGKLIFMPSHIKAARIKLGLDKG